MGEIDKSVKSYLKIPEIFTQLFNECFFDEEHYIKPESLVERDSVISVPTDTSWRNDVGGSVLEKEYAKGKKKYMEERTRDVCMLSASGMEFRILLGIEEQTEVHYYMPVRVMLMDAMNYERQCREKAAEARARGKNFSPVSGAPEGTEIYPAMTIVLYIGEEKWNGPKELYDMFKLPDKEKNWLKSYVANYPMHLIDARHMDEEELTRFTGDLKIFFTLLRDNYNEETIKGMIAKYPDTWYTLSIIKRDERYRLCAKINEVEEKEGGMEMDPNLDRIENKGYQRGMSQGLSQGISQGLSLINELYKKLTADGRNSDWQRSLEDEAYQRQLLREYGLMEQ